jgi:hypothetical protein
VVLGAAIGVATVIGLAGRGHGVGVAFVAPSNAPPSVPPDKDPSRPEYLAARMAEQIGAPTGFAIVRNSWSGSTLQYQYAMHCRQGACATDPVNAIARWAAAAGMDSRSFAVANLPTCLRTTCMDSYRRSGFFVSLSAFSAADTSYSSRPGDVVYLTGVTIRET